MTGKRSFCKLLFYIMLLFYAIPLFAGETGKISGVIRDAQTGEPLVGVNVVVEGTVLGGTTDEDGLFVILQLRPGHYALEAMYIGYADMRVENIRVLVDHTTRIDFSMSQKAVEGSEVIVTAERPVVQKDITSSVQFVGAQELEQLPIIDAKEGLFLQTGVLFDGLTLQGRGGKGEARYAIRGGGQEEVKWYIDGVRTASQVQGVADRGGSFTSVNLNAIEEVQVITGGFNAEYGEAQSGIINVVTKEGSDQFSGAAEIIYSPPGQRHFGNYVYDQSTQKEFQDNRLPDGSLDPNWWTDYRQSQVYDYRDFDDRTLNLSLGGPIFTTDDTRGTFFISSQVGSYAYTYPRPRDTRDVRNLMVNTGFRLGSNIKLNISGLYDSEEHSTLQEGSDYTSQAKYYRGWGSLVNTSTTSFSARLTHTLSNKMYYDLKLSRFSQKIVEKPSEFTVLGESPNPDIWGYDKFEGYPNEPFDQFAFIYDQQMESGDVSLVGSLNWQFDANNFMKTGFEFRYNTVNEVKSNRYPSFSDHPDDWINRGLHEKYNPIQFAGFVQDKMEFEGMILNFGLRYDYFNPNRDWFDFTNLYNLAIDPDFDPALDPDGDQVDSLGRVKYSFDNVLAKPRKPARDYHMFSPRLGVSFPVTERTVLRFNYGHFQQMPPFDRMFELTYFRPEYIAKGIYNARNNGVVRHVASNDGDPERVVFLTLEPLKPERTVQFEVGVNHNFRDMASLSLTGFYKDLFDQSEPRTGLFDRRVYGYDPFNNRITPNTFYVSNFPGDYGDSRGFELSARTLLSSNWNIDINYSFSIATEGRATPGQILIDGEGEVEYRFDDELTQRLLIEKVYSRPHILRANLYLRYPDNKYEGLVSTLLNGGSASLLFKLTSGPTLTYLAPDNPEITYHNERYPAIKTLDLRLDKKIRLFGRQEILLYSRITNLLNTKNLRSFGDIFFDANALSNFVEKGEVSQIDGGGYDISYQTYYEPRRFYFGMKYSF